MNPHEKRVIKAAVEWYEASTKKEMVSKLIRLTTATNDYVRATRKKVKRGRGSR